MEVRRVLPVAAQQVITLSQEEFVKAVYSYIEERSSVGTLFPMEGAKIVMIYSGKIRITLQESINQHP